MPDQERFLYWNNILRFIYM